MNDATPTLRKLTDQKHVNLYSLTRETPTGKSTWTFASRKPAATAGTVSADAVSIIAIVAAPDGPRLLVTREFRSPLGRHELSVPSGLIDAGESVEAAGARELREETGLTLSRVFHVSPPVASSAGLTDETVCLLYGEATGEPSRKLQTEHEDIEARFLCLADIRALLREPGADVISSRLYPMLVGFVAAGSFRVPLLA